MREVRRQQWLEIIRDRQNSGETVRGYCAARGISEKSYYYWQRRLREAACQGLAMCGERQDIVEISLAGEDAYQKGEQSTHTGAASITVRMNGAEIEITGDVRPELAESILRALKC